MTERDQIDAVTQLIARPDAFDAARTHHQTQPGKPERFVLWADLPKVYVATMRAERDRECVQ